MSNAISFTSLAQSNLPASQKSKIRQFFDKMGGHVGGRAKTHIVEGAHAVRAAGESVVVGAALAAAHVELKNGLDINGKAPIDAMLAVAGLGGAVLMANEPMAQDLRNAGASAATVFAFRKTYALLAEKKLSKGGVVGGGFSTKPALHAGEFAGGASYGADPSEDPIIAAARAL